MANKADVNVKNKSGATPFLLATQAGKIHVIKTLHQSSVNINMGDVNGLTPLHAAAESVTPSSYEIAKFLVDHGAIKSQKTTSGLTPLDMAKSKKDNQLMYILK